MEVSGELPNDPRACSLLSGTSLGQSHPAARVNRCHWGHTEAIDLLFSLY